MITGCVWLIPFPVTFVCLPVTVIYVVVYAFRLRLIPLLRVATLPVYAFRLPFTLLTFTRGWVCYDFGCVTLRYVTVVTVTHFAFDLLYTRLLRLRYVVVATRLICYTRCTRLRCCHVYATGYVYVCSHLRTRLVGYVYVCCGYGYVDLVTFTFAFG